MTEQTEARALFRSAYENRYTWDANFPGYSADIQLKQGDEVYTGKVRINADMSFDVSDVVDEEAKKSIQGQLWEIAVHRVRRSFDETHGKNLFSFGETDDNGAIEILVEGKAMGDRYKVRNNEVSFVHRHIHGVVVTINTFSSLSTNEGYLSRSYDSVYQDAKTGELKGTSQFEDSYEKIDGYYILTNRLIRSSENGQDTSTEFNFSNIKLLKPALV